ncbi:hypothetical protein CAL7102_03257 [Dulcicalothrix desertica PCC 7102]|nr:hypothetical protein CAL7102_03257 [Dulcicalothrix desertica PCC 7102]
MPQSFKFSLITALIVTSLTSTFIDWHWGGMTIAGFLLIYISKGIRSMR